MVFIYFVSISFATLHICSLKLDMEYTVTILGNEKWLLVVYSRPVFEKFMESLRGSTADEDLAYFRLVVTNFIFL